MKKILILVWAGASKFCNYTDKGSVKFINDNVSDEYKMPPLGDELFNELVNNGYSEELSKLPDDLKEVFKTEGFEKGMEKCLSTDVKNKDLAILWTKSQKEIQEYVEHLRTSTIDEAKLLREMWKYFLRFYISTDDKENNLYYLLLKNLIANNIELSISSLNYECLIEEAFKHINNTNSKFQFIKPHGSANFLPIMAVNGKIRSSQLSILAATKIGKIGPTKVFLREDALNHINGENWLIIPVMSRYMQNKEGSLNDDYIKEHKQYLKEKIESSDKIIVIGVKITEEDTHIWSNLAKSKADICYVSWSDLLFNDWKDKNNRNTKNDIHRKGFRDMFNTMDSFPDIVNNFLTV